MNIMCRMILQRDERKTVYETNSETQVPLLSPKLRCITPLLLLLWEGPTMNRLFTVSSISKLWFTLKIIIGIINKDYRG